jgi:MFS transporter, PPP family, 3-phenylpropionic acid transporter
MDQEPSAGGEAGLPRAGFGSQASSKPVGRLDRRMLRTSAFFFTLMGPSAISNLGLALWLADRRISDSWIGLVNAAPLIGVLVLGLLIGRIADRTANWRAVIVICSLVAALGSALLELTHGFLAVALVWSLTIVPFLAMTPVADAAAVRVAARAGSSYGAIRIWGTIGFVVTIVIAGFGFQRFGVSAFVPVLVAVSLARAMLAFLLPDLRLSSKSGATGPRRPFAVTEFREIKQLMQPWFLAPIFAGALLSGSHAAQNGFGPLIWKSEGVSDGLIGIYLAIAPAAEIGAMALSHWVLSKFSARAVLLGCCLIGTARWCGYVAPLNPFAVGFLQTLHLVTFGFGYVAIVVFGGAWSHDSIAAQVQSFATLARNIVAIATYAAFGVLTERVGAYVFFVAAGMCGVGVVLCAWSLWVRPPSRRLNVHALESSGQ